MCTLYSLVTFTNYVCLAQESYFDVAAVVLDSQLETALHNNPESREWFVMEPVSTFQIWMES